VTEPKKVPELIYYQYKKKFDN